MRSAFTHPSFVKAISSVAGIDLIPIMSLELGHTNFAAMGGTKEDVRNLRDEPSEPMDKMDGRDDDGKEAAHVVVRENKHNVFTR